MRGSAVVAFERAFRAGAYAAQRDSGEMGAQGAHGVRFVRVRCVGPLHADSGGGCDGAAGPPPHEGDNA